MEGRTQTKEKKNMYEEKRERERERYTSLPGFGCVCVEKKERGNDPLVRQRDETTCANWNVF